MNKWYEKNNMVCVPDYADSTQEFTEAECDFDNCVNIPVPMDLLLQYFRDTDMPMTEAEIRVWEREESTCDETAMLMDWLYNHHYIWKRITKEGNQMSYTYSHDYHNDTRLMIADTEQEGWLQLILSFTSEDPDFGTETLYYPDITGRLKENQWQILAETMLADLTTFLDKTHDGNFRPYKLIRTLPNGDIFEDYANSSLYAFENMLKELLNK